MNSPRVAYVPTICEFSGRRANELGGKTNPSPKVTLIGFAGVAGNQIVGVGREKLRARQIEHKLVRRTLGDRIAAGCYRPIQSPGRRYRRPANDGVGRESKIRPAREKPECLARQPRPTLDIELLDAVKRIDAVVILRELIVDRMDGEETDIAGDRRRAPPRPAPPLHVIRIHLSAAGQDLGQRFSAQANRYSPRVPRARGDNERTAGNIAAHTIIARQN